MLFRTLSSIDRVPSQEKALKEEPKKAKPAKKKEESEEEDDEDEEDFEVTGDAHI